MLQKNNRYNVLKVFLSNPLEDFGLRELSRLSKLSPPSVLNYLLDFEEENLVKKEEKKRKPIYRAERDSSNFKLFQKLSIIYELNSSGLVDFLWEKLSPEAIILYGSYAKGEAIDKSDIDIYLIGSKSEIELSSFERKLGKKVHILNGKLSGVSNELKNNLINGIILRGFLKAF